MCYRTNLVEKRNSFLSSHGHKPNKNIQQVTIVFLDKRLSNLTWELNIWIQGYWLYCSLLSWASPLELCTIEWRRIQSGNRYGHSLDRQPVRDQNRKSTVVSQTSSRLINIHPNIFTAIIKHQVTYLFTYQITEYKQEQG